MLREATQEIYIFSRAYGAMPTLVPGQSTEKSPRFARQVDNLRLKCRLFQMFPILGPDHHPPPPRTVTYTGSVKRQTPIGAHVALAAVWPLLACLRVELICLPAATRWGCEPNLEALRLRPEASPPPLPLWPFA